MKLFIESSFRFKLLIVIMVCVLYSCQKPSQLQEPQTSDLSSKAQQNSQKQAEESADVPFQWYNFMTVLQRTVAPQPLVFIQARAYAYIGVGLFEAVQPGIQSGKSLSNKLYQMPAMPKPDHSKKYLWSASANAAIASMLKQFLVSLSPANKASIDAKELAIYNQLMLTNNDDVMIRSAAFGRSIATAIYNWSTSDNFSVTSGTYSPLTQSWAWVPTFPNFPKAIGDNLEHSRPFLKYSLDATAPPMPVVYSENPTSAFYMAAKEVHDLGGKITGTPANKATANWWADAGGVGVGAPAPYHLLSIVTSVLESQHSGLWKAAEVYAKTGIALKDGPIGTFRAKYQYNLLRPITYIRRFIDKTWESHLINPPYPEYPSGLVCFYGTLIQVLINEFGDIPATDNVYFWRNLPARHFKSLSLMRAEAATSRIYAGIHYRFTQNVSIELGIKLGNEISKIKMHGLDDDE